MCACVRAANWSGRLHACHHTRRVCAPREREHGDVVMHNGVAFLANLEVGCPDRPQFFTRMHARTDRRSLLYVAFWLRMCVCITCFPNACVLLHRAATSRRVRHAGPRRQNRKVRAEKENDDGRAAKAPVCVCERGWARRIAQPARIISACACVCWPRQDGLVLQLRQAQTQIVHDPGGAQETLLRALAQVWGRVGQKGGEGSKQDRGGMNEAE